MTYNKDNMMILLIGSNMNINDLKVKDFMTGNPVVAQSNVNLPRGVGIMATEGIGNLIVKTHKNTIGILTEREILQYLSADREIPTHLLLADVGLQSYDTVNPATTVLDAAKKTISKKQRILVSSDHSDVIGIITASDMVKAFAKQTSNNPSLESVITKKIFSIDVNDSIYDAVDIMNNRNIGSVIIVESNTDSSSIKNTPYGIFTERDLLTKVLSKDVSLNEKIKDYCSTELITANVGIRAIEAANIMMTSKIKRLLLTELPSTVAKEDSLNGKKKKKNISAIVTARDLVEVFQS